MNALLIAGIGNIFAGDDGFGVEVVRRLCRRSLPPEAHVCDFGNRARDLVYALCDDYDAAVLIDATARGGAPGTLYVLEPEQDARALADASSTPAASAALALAHGLDPNAILQMVATLPVRCRRIVIVGCEPLSLGEELVGSMELSAPVAAAVESAIELVQRLAMELRGVSP